MPLKTRKDLLGWVSGSRSESQEDSIGPIDKVVHKRSSSLVYQSVFLKNTIKNLSIKPSLTWTDFYWFPFITLASIYRSPASWSLKSDSV